MQFFGYGKIESDRESDMMLNEITLAAIPHILLSLDKQLNADGSLAAAATIILQQ